MSEDRLERALQETETGRRRRRGRSRLRGHASGTRLTSASGATCAEFRPDFRAYLGGELGGSRRVLVEDHLSRCPAMPRRRSPG